MYTYSDQKDFLDRYPNSTWNVNTVTIQTVTTDSQHGIASGEPVRGAFEPRWSIPRAPTNTGAFATNAVLVK